MHPRKRQKSLQNRDDPILELGKLPPDMLEEMLSARTGAQDPRLRLGPSPGEDVGVVENGARCLVFKTDPVTFATDRIGWYAVHVNANDVATSGARPSWFQACILLPQNRTRRSDADAIFAQIHEACLGLGVSVVGGHTEVTHGLNHAVVVGSMIGEVETTRLITTGGANQGDRLLLTKGIVIEGTAIMARERYAELKSKGIAAVILERAASFLDEPGISVVPEARIAADLGATSMHDPTEGGLRAGIMEMALASGLGVRVNRDDIPLMEESRLLCQALDLDPLGTITSGSLLVAAPPAEALRIRNALTKAGILCTDIGVFREPGAAHELVGDKGIHPLTYSTRDEITRIFSIKPPDLLA